MKHQIEELLRAVVAAYGEGRYAELTRKLGDYVDHLEDENAVLCDGVNAMHPDSILESTAAYLGEIGYLKFQLSETQRVLSQLFGLTKDKINWGDVLKVRVDHAIIPYEKQKVEFRDGKRVNEPHNMKMPHIEDIAKPPKPLRAAHAEMFGAPPDQMAFIGVDGIHKLPDPEVKEKLDKALEHVRTAPKHATGTATVDKVVEQYPDGRVVFLVTCNYGKPDSHEEFYVARARPVKNIRAVRFMTTNGGALHTVTENKQFYIVVSKEHAPLIHPNDQLIFLPHDDKVTGFAEIVGVAEQKDRMCYTVQVKSGMLRFTQAFTVNNNPELKDYAFWTDQVFSLHGIRITMANAGVTYTMYLDKKDGILRKGDVLKFWRQHK